jgi:PAS domain S-box-containing protein
MSSNFFGPRLVQKGKGNILDSIADGVITINHDWRITSFNRAAEQIAGGRREEAIGQR